MVFAPSALLQVPIGLEEFHEGVVDLVQEKAIVFSGAKGQELKVVPIPEDLKEEVEAKRAELVEKVSEVRPGQNTS
jgi:elongation factor G